MATGIRVRTGKLWAVGPRALERVDGDAAGSHIYDHRFEHVRKLPQIARMTRQGRRATYRGRLCTILHEAHNRRIGLDLILT